MDSTACSPLIGFGNVWHVRLRPSEHRFRYAAYMLLLPMRAMRANGATGNEPAALRVYRPGLLSFWDADHGDGRSTTQGGALAWMEELLKAHGIADVDGEIWLQCFPRVFGYTFKPVSFWYCHARNGGLRAIVVEVNNTFGDRHVYLLDAPVPGQEIRAAKAMHVSPFCRVEGGYRFRFEGATTACATPWKVLIDYDDSQGPLLRTGLSGRYEILNAQTRRKALLRYPMQTFMVTLRIHWHALRLWLKRVPFHGKPARSSQSVTLH